MWMMLQQDHAEDYVIATGTNHSVKEFLELAFSSVGLHWEDYVVTDPKFLRPAEVDHLLGDASKAKKNLGWQPEVDFKGLVHMMVEADLARYKAQMRA
jgi:GDPmannose 4,6-dehydratase